MNKGSKRVTVRLGEEAIEEIRRACQELQSRWDCSKEWTLTEFIVTAVVEKLDKMERGRRKEPGFKLEKVDEFKPREWQTP